MKAYLTSLLIAALLVAFFAILSPNGERGGLFARQKLLSSLFLICVILSPLQGAMHTLSDFFSGDLSIFNAPSQNEAIDYQEQLEAAVNTSSKQYFTQLLCQTLCEQFAISSDDLRCTVSWKEGEAATPQSITVILSGKAIWKDPHEIEQFTDALLGIPCDVAIE